MVEWSEIAHTEWAGACRFVTRRRDLVVEHATRGFEEIFHLRRLPDPQVRILDQPRVIAITHW
jgi:hypothetical protein